MNSKKKLLSISILIFSVLNTISAKAQDNWTEWNITNQDFSDPQTKEYLFNNLPQVIDPLLILKENNNGDNNVLVKEEDREKFSTVYLCALVGWCDYLKLSLCDAYGLELISYSDAKLYDQLFPKMNTFAIDFLKGEYTDGQSPTEYEYFPYKSVVENIIITLENINNHINIYNYIDDPKTIPTLTSIKEKTRIEQKNTVENTIDDNVKEKYETTNSKQPKPYNSSNNTLIILIIVTILFIGLQFLFGKIRVKPILRSLLFGLIVISATFICMADDISDIDGTTVILIGATILLFSLITFPLYRSIDKNKIKNNKYIKLNFYNFIYTKVPVKSWNTKTISISCIAFVLGPYTLIYNIVLRLIYNIKRKECENLPLYKNEEKRNLIGLILQSIFLICFILIKTFTYSRLLTILFWFIPGVIGFFYASSIYTIIEALLPIMNFIKNNEYFDLAGKYKIDAKECNSILYLKKTKIDDYSYTVEQKIILSYTLHQVKVYKAIGIQKFSKFYYINLESIYKQLDLKLTEEERISISNAIAKSYGNDKLDKFDWAIGSSIGLITGLMDVFLVGKPGDSKLQGIVDNFTEKSVRLAGKLNGFTDNDLSKIVAKLEKKYWVPYDKASISEIDMNTDNHHLQSLAHANDIVGLIFAIADIKLSIEKSIENGGTLYSVVTCNYSKDPETIKKIQNDSRFEFIFGGVFVRFIEPLTFISGKNQGLEKNISTLQNCLYKVLYEKCKNADETKRNVMFIISGFIIWLGHLYSDKIGASGTVAKENRGSGIGAPFQELFIGGSKNISEKLNKFTPSELENKITDLAKDMFEQGFDNRFFNTQKIPVFINEYFTKIIYIIKEIGINNKTYTFKEIIQILFPEGMIKGGSRLISTSSDFELQKTLLVSYSVFSIVDVGDALISSGATVPGVIVPNIDTFLSINYPGLIKVGQESVSVFLSYLHRWTDSPEKIVKKIEKIALDSEQSNY